MCIITDYLGAYVYIKAEHLIIINHNTNTFPQHMQLTKGYAGRLNGKNIAAITVLDTPISLREKPRPPMFHQCMQDTN